MQGNAAARDGRRPRELDRTVDDSPGDGATTLAEAGSDLAALDGATSGDGGSAAAASAAPGTEPAMAVTAPPSDGGASGAVLTLHDSGKSVDLAVGAPLTVELKVTPGAGYTWDLTKNDAKILALASGAPTQPSAPDQPGGHATQTFAFVGKAPGKAHLELAYRRPWEKDQKPAKTFAIDVTVKQP